VDTPSSGTHNRNTRARSNERLDSWKAIAAHFGRTVRTVQRWERENGLPVHRLLHNTSSSVYAFTQDLDDWLAKREPSPAQDGTAMVPAPRRTGAPSLRVNSDAKECYQKARHFMGKRTASAVALALREYRKALDIAPTWALPHAGISEAYVVLTGSEFKAPHDGYPKARAAALQALELEPALPSAHAALGFVKAFYDADWPGAGAEFRAAIAADPTSAVAHYWSGLALMNQGCFGEAQAAIQRAIDLAPLSAAMTANASRPLIVAGDWDGALACCHRAMDLDSELWMVHLFMGFALDGKGEHDEACRCFETSMKLGGSGGVWGSLACACARGGDRRIAMEMVQEMSAQGAIYVSPLRFARIAVALGDRDMAFSWLERACADHSIRSNCYPQYDYALEPLRTDPRFMRLIGHLNLPR
jgi:tetratricopeptide (TPR) repeat protein